MALLRDYLNDCGIGYGDNDNWPRGCDFIDYIDFIIKIKRKSSSEMRKVFQ